MKVFLTEDIINPISTIMCCLWCIEREAVIECSDCLDFQEDAMWRLPDFITSESPLFCSSYCHDSFYESEGTDISQRDFYQMNNWLSLL